MIIVLAAAVAGILAVVVVSLILSHVGHQVQFDLVVLEVVATLVRRSSLQAVRYFLKVLTILLETVDVDFLLLWRPLVGTGVRGTTARLFLQVCRVRVPHLLIHLNATVDCSNACRSC